ncbi:hypothetical protein BS50DRAFT_591120 [Corynespora cassiicola Philippines]|uniref:Extracellular membrane protein CFEM domain-containing protein n=1 Tax=Corynespora cassiicola Philippines TaxID=1448308 RepID=A0A2T2NFE3_CORCC|nr:hypothetical protein BS50DRAFT_591120 [Corynespora cassiicola Philippines]
MKSIASFSIIVALSRAVCAAPEPAITPRAELPVARRQDTLSDPARLGWVSESGASEFSDMRSCDSPQTLSRSGSLAQCCSPTGACEFWSTCSDGNLIAGSSSVFCDQGYCNTAVLVATPGASDGASFLGCWATSLGEDPFTIVQNVASAALAIPTTSPGSGSDEGSSSGSSRATSARSSAGSSAEESLSEGSATGSAPAATESTGAAAFAAEPLTGVFGAVAMLYALL